MVITCIGAVSVVLFPMLKKMKGRDLRGIVFDHANGSDGSGFSGADLLHTDALDIRALAAVYHDSLHYLAVLFPICVYETRSVALIDTYLKAYRKEKLIFLTVL